MKKPIRLLMVLLLVVFQIARMVAAESTCEGCTHDKAYSAAQVYGTKPTRGVILHLHECDGLRVDQGWQREWVDYLTLHGFLIIAIDSFADVRPPPVACPGNPWVYAKNLIYTLRTRQAQHARLLLPLQGLPNSERKKCFVSRPGEGNVNEPKR